MKKDEVKHLEFIYDRLVYKHHENKKNDFMLYLKKTIDKYNKPNNSKKEVIVFKGNNLTKFLLTIFSPIIAPIWLFSKFVFKTKSIKIKIEYK